MNTVAVIAGFAGLATGLAIAVAAFALYIRIDSQKQIRHLDRERKLLMNKLFVRDGQATIFPDALVHEGLDVPAKSQPAPSKTMTSPFRSGLKNKREELNKTPAAEAAINLPSSVKANITKAAEEARNAA